MHSRQVRILLTVAAGLAILVGLLLGAKACTAKQAEEEAAAAQAERSARAVPTKSDAFVSISYDNSVTNLAFTKDEADAWIWADDPTVPLDGKYMEELSALITNLDPMQTITDGDTLAAYGLETPSGTINATAADGAQTVLLLGKALSDGSYYLKTDDSDTVYVVSKDLHERINKGVYDMALLEQFPALTEENLRAVTITGPKTTALTVSPGEDGHGVWSLDGTDVTAQPDIAALSAQLSALAFTACRDFNPSAKAVEICGLTKPAVIVTVDYADANGADAQMVLSIGGNTPEGDGRYARLDDSTTIYSLTNESLSTILDIARNGLTPS